MKVKGFNLFKKKYPKHLNIIKKEDWTIFPKDKVYILQGKDSGQSANVTACLYNSNSCLLENKNLAIKHLKPNPNQPNGQIIQKAQPISLSNLALIDPDTKIQIPIDNLKIIKKFNTIKLKTETFRVNAATSQIIPIPEKPDIYKSQADGPLDTSVDAVKQVSFNPMLSVNPFPVKFLNELHKHARNKRESHAL